MRQFAFDIFAGADKVLGIVVVLFNPGRHGEDIRVKDDVFRREAHLFGENFVSPAANFNFPLAGIGLAHFIKGHHHDGGAVAAHLFACWINGSTPSFIEMELTMPLPEYTSGPFR